MRKTAEISSRERIHLALDHVETDRIPVAMVCSAINEPAAGDFNAYLMRERGIDLKRYLDAIIDIREVAPRYIGPAHAPGVNIWGVRRKPVAFGLGAYDEIDHYPLAGAETMDDVVRHSWPSPDWFDYAGLRESIAAAQKGGPYCLMVHNGNIFETSWYMRGFERMFEDLALNPDLAHGIMRRVTDFYIEFFRRILSAVPSEIDLVFTADDIGGQTGLLLSLDMWERFIKPYHVELNRAIHEFGVRVIYHSDGAVMEAVPGLIDMGIDVLQALQFDASGMDPLALKTRHGKRLCFEGGASVQKTLPFGSVEQVREEVRNLISVLGRNGGYIFGPSHAIQAGTPPENIYAMFETALNYYPFRQTATS